MIWTNLRPIILVIWSPISQLSVSIGTKTHLTHANYRPQPIWFQLIRQPITNPQANYWTLSIWLNRPIVIQTGDPFYPFEKPTAAVTDSATTAHSGSTTSPLIVDIQVDIRRRHCQGKIPQPKNFALAPPSPRPSVWTLSRNTCSKTRRRSNSSSSSRWRHLAENGVARFAGAAAARSRRWRRWRWNVSRWDLNVEKKRHRMHRQGKYPSTTFKWRRADRRHSHIKTNSSP